MTKIYTDVVIVDNHDRPIGAMQLPEAIKLGDIMRVSRVFIFNSKNELLLQKRSQHVFAPGLYSESAAGHVDSGENYIQAARRELKEELGIDANLQFVCHYYYEEKVNDFSIKRFNNIYTAQSEGPFTTDPEEVESVEFFSPQELDHRILRSPHDFPEGFIHAYQQYKNSINKK